MAAERCRCETILGYLVERGADINIKDNKGVNTIQLTINTTESKWVLQIWFDLASHLFHSR